MRLAALATAVGLLVGCGESNATRSVDEPLVGVWELAGHLEGGALRAAKPGFRCFLNSDLTWTDSDGEGGIWETDGGLFRLTYADGRGETYRYDIRDDGSLALLPVEGNRAAGPLSIYRSASRASRR